MSLTNALEYLQALGHETTEVRISCKDKKALGPKSFTGDICFGYYSSDQYDKLIQDIETYNDCENIESIWVTIQDIDSALLARSANRIKHNAGSGETTSIKDITHFTHFPIDIDPSRPSKISSSQLELKVAAEAAQRMCKEALLGYEVMKAMSGNGYHLLIPIHPLENTEKNYERWKRVGDIFAHDVMGIIEGIDEDALPYSNPTLKLYGTTSRKGDSTKERPHRVSSVKIPETIIRYDFDAIEALILGYEDKVRTGRSKSKAKSSFDKINLEDFLRENGVKHAVPKNTPEGIVFPMQCPFDEDHGRDAFAIQRLDGKWGWECFHSSCEGNDWHEFRALVAPKSLEYGRPIEGNQKRGYVDDNNIVIEDIEEIEDIPLDRLDFPQEELMDGIFSFMKGACKDRPDLRPEFLHAVTMNNIGAVIGRRIWLEDDPPVFPNQYTVIVGRTGFSRKTTVTKLGKVVLKIADENVIRQNALATPEGLIDLFVFPNGLWPGCEIPSDYEEVYEEIKYEHRKGIAKSHDKFDELLRSRVENSDHEEGLRMQLVQNELSVLLRKSKRSSGMGLVECLTEFYDMEDSVSSPTKSKPTSAPYPCLSVIGSTTMAWLEKNIDIDDIQGGFVNRFSFYLAEDIDESAIKMFYPLIDKGLIQEVAKIINGIRLQFPNPTGFDMEDEAKEYAEDWNSKIVREVAEIKNESVRESLSRYALHFKKFSLIYALFDNGIGDTTIKLKSVKKGCLLASYHIAVAKKLFGSFTISEEQRAEDIVYHLIRSKGTRGMTPREIASSSRHVASSKKALEALVSLETAGFVGKSNIPNNPGRFRWHALKEIDLDRL